MYSSPGQRRSFGREDEGGKTEVSGLWSRKAHVFPEIRSLSSTSTPSSPSRMFDFKYTKYLITFDIRNRSSPFPPITGGGWERRSGSRRERGGGL